MTISTRHLKQTATLWTAGATDVYGNPTFSAPVTVPCRWEDKQTKAIDFQGNDIISNSIVYVDRDYTMGDYLMLGTSVSATPPSIAKEVRNFSKVPNLRATDFTRKVVL
jgi:hypothetical protein